MAVELISFGFPLQEVLSMDLVSFGAAAESMFRIQSQRSLAVSSGTRAAFHADKNEWRNWCKQVSPTQPKQNERSFLNKFGAKGI